MFRRVMFLVLSLVLALILGWTVLTSRKEKPQGVAPEVEIVKKSKSTPTRVLHPQDLTIVNATMKLSRSLPDDVPAPQGGGLVRATHSVVIRNDGDLAYSNIVLSFSYRNKEGKQIDTRAHTLSDPLPPGGVVSIEELVIDGLPSKTSGATPTVLYSDLKPD